MKTVLEKARAKAYENTDPRPVHPTMPNISNIRACDLTSRQLREAAEAKNHYEQARDAYEAATATWEAKNRQLGSTFEAELAAEHGMTDHPKRVKLFEFVKERCRMDGYEYLAIDYAQLVELVK